MNNNLSKILIFIVGAACGSAVTNYLLKSKYEQKYQEEVASVKEVFSRRANAEKAINEIQDEENAEARKKADEAREKPSVMEYAAILQKQGYTRYSDTEDEVKTDDNEEEDEDEENTNLDNPYVISPEEFGEFDDYEEICLRYYADGILTDDQDELVEDVDDVVGYNSLNKFGLYEDDSVHVRNDRLKADYEILWVSRNYSDARKNDPHLMEER